MCVLRLIAVPRPEEHETLAAMCRERKETLREVVEARRELNASKALNTERIAEIHEQLDARLRERQERRAELLKRESERAAVSTNSRAAAAAARSEAARTEHHDRAAHSVAWPRVQSPLRTTHMLHITRVHFYFKKLVCFRPMSQSIFHRQTIRRP